MRLNRVSIVDRVRSFSPPRLIWGKADQSVGEDICNDLSNTDTSLNLTKYLKGFCVKDTSGVVSENISCENTPTSQGRRSLSVINPSSGEHVLDIPFSIKDEVRAKVKLAKDTFPLWRNLDIEERINYLKRIYNLILKNKDLIAKTITLENGKPLAESYLTELGSTLQVMDYFIRKGRKLLSDEKIPLGFLYPTKKSFNVYEPYGTLAIIEPWNYPFYLSMSTITKALLAGNTFVFKPSEYGSLVGKLIEKIITDADLPYGVCNFVYGDGSIGESLVSSNIDKVFFTGSTQVGNRIAESCGERLVPVSLELGGKDPAIVLKDCNLDYVAKGIVWGALTNCGQACASIERVYVHKDIHDELIKKIVDLVKKLNIGNGFDEKTDVGPLNNQNQLNKVQDHLQDALEKGAVLHTGGRRINREGFFFEPTVLSNVNSSMKVMTEETFGPIIPICSFETNEEAIVLANSTKYGLSASIWTSKPYNRETRSLASSLESGTVWINDSLFQQAYPACNWEGYKESGYGGSSIYDFVRTKHISYDRGYIPVVRPSNLWWYPYKGKTDLFRKFVDVLFGIVFRKPTS